MLTESRATPFATLLCAALCANFLVVAGHNAQRIVEIAALLLVSGAVLARRRLALDTLFGGAAGAFLAAFFVLGLVGSVVAFSPRLALFEVASLFLLYLWATQVGDEIVRRGLPALRAVLQATAAIAILYSVQFAVAYASALSFGNPLMLDDFTSGFSNFRFFNHVQTALLPLFVLLCCPPPGRDRFRPLWLGITSYWWMALFATTGRGTLVGIATGCVVAAVVLRRRAIPYVRAVLLTLALGLVAYFVFLVAIPALTGAQGMRAFSYAVERTAANPASSRTILWHRAIGLAAEHPWLGAGPMHFAHHANDLHIGAHPHDWVLQIASEWGLPALGALLAAIVLGLRALLRAGKRVADADGPNQATFAALLVAAVAILVDGLVSGLFVMPQSQLAIALYLGCAIGWVRSTLPAAAAPAARYPARWRGGIAIVLVIAAMAATAAVWPEALARIGHQPLTPAEALANGYDHLPRLWDTGYF
jgi:O-antigen ligase